MSKMIKTFESTIRLEKVSGRITNLIATLNSTALVGSAMMVVVVLDASPIPGTNEILGKIQFSIKNNLKVVFGVITPNIDDLMLFASRFNMASAMHCTIRYSIKGESLNIKFKPPNEKLEEVLRDFFELTEKSSNWIVENDNSVWQHIIYPTDSHWVSVGINLKKRNTSCEVFLFHFIIILLILQFLELHKLLI